MIRLAVDCMGGDFGPSITVPAVISFLHHFQDAEVFLVGLQEAIEAEVERYFVKNVINRDKKLTNRMHFLAASQVIAMDDSISTSLRRKKGSSIHVALNLVKNHICEVCVSAGNTGSLVAISRSILKTVPNIDRPVLAAAMPHMNGGYTTVLDLGANIDCEVKHLFQFAHIGHALVSTLNKQPFPSIGLLNVGEESIKGSDIVKETAELLRLSHLNFYGNVEGNDIYLGTTDIVVCDGFIGNAILKASEGLAKMLSQGLREEFSKNFLTKFLALISRPVFSKFKHRFDPRQYSGAILLGLTGLVIKSHGASDIIAFRSALGKAYNAAKAKVQKQLVDALMSEPIK